MAKSRKPRLKLSFAQANAICRELMPIGDKVYDHRAQLRQAGFHAFIPREEFVGSFARSAEDVELHRRCVKERAKERLGRPFPMLIFEEDEKQVFKSSFLQSLKEERDRDNGVPVNQLSTRYSGGEAAWRSEIDPCQRRLVQDRVSQRDAHEARFTAMLEAERRALEDEAARHGTGLGKVPHTFDNKGRYAFFAAVMERDAAPMGFAYDKPKSRFNYPVFSKTITGEWDLCWVLEDLRGFFHSPFEGHFEPSLELRSNQFRGTLAKVESGDFLLIRYADLVLNNGYWKFCNLDELERSIRAHLYLYSLMAPLIEGAVKKVLERPAA